MPLDREGCYPGKGMLKDGLKERMRKVASKPGA